MHISPWILASNSPRRKELLALFGHPFLVHPADVDERLKPGEQPVQYVSRLASEKALVVRGVQPAATLILAADTTVALGETIYGKPDDAHMAREMLWELRGKTHQVYTAVTLHTAGQEIGTQVICRSDVPMRAYSPEEVDLYAASGDPLDKAGAYAIQNEQFHPVQYFGGCFASVMGLPLCHIAFALAGLKKMPEVDIAEACQQHLKYNCPIHERVLRGENLG